MKRKIIFRADGSATIGMGHFIRTLALAEMLNEHFHCIYATRKPTEYQIAEIEKVCHERIDLPDDDSHFNEFLSHLKGDEIVVLDNYYFTTEYQKAIKTKGCKLVCIDDMHDKHYVADVVINYAPICREKFSIESYTTLLVGFDFALLRPVFLTQNLHRKSITKISHALIFFGGADFNNLTFKTLENLSKIEKIEKITIVIGSAFQSKAQLEDKVARYFESKSIEVFENVSSNKLIKIMNDVDIGIVPCSSVLFEAISQKLPVITGFYVNNQKEIATELKDKYDHILVIGNLNSEEVNSYHIEQLENKIQNKIYEPSISPNVCINIQKGFKSLQKEYSINIRQATLNDIDIYYQWANDKDVRNNAIKTEPIKYENHIKWFNNKITDESAFLYIFEKENAPVGQVRFDNEKGFLSIGYSIDKKYRGQGLGSLIIKKGIEKLISELSSSNSYILNAFVKEDNVASAKVFEKLNFLQTDIKHINENKYLVFQKKLK